MDKNSMLLNEEISGSRNAAIVYHRTNSIDTIKDIVNDEFKTDTYGHYGKGFYSFYDTWSLSNHQEYGNIILKCLVNNLRGNFLIFDKWEAQKIYGENYQLEDQIPSLGRECKDYLLSLKDDFNSGNVNYLIDFTDKFRHLLGGKIAGIVYGRSYDGTILVLYKYKKSQGFLYPIGYKKDTKYEEYNDNGLIKVRYNQEFKEPNDINNLNENKVLNNYIKYKVKQILNAK